MKKLTYKTSGVDIAKANQFVKAIQGNVKSTLSPAVLKDAGAFGSLFALGNQYKDPVLVSSTDGVGTKLLIAQTFNKHDTVGIDLVAMNVNDVLCVGAKPLFFLDYIACGKVKPRVLQDVVKGIAQGCRQAGCGLIGGETAEMPGMYSEDEYDLAGFTVGVVERNAIVSGKAIKPGDCVLGLPSSGVHSNGYSLVRKVFSNSEQRKFLKQILAPTVIYVPYVLPLLNRFKINGIAHLTGGAWFEKLTKILPDGLSFEIRKNSWPVLDIFERIQKKGNVPQKEMYRTFNMGIGMALVVSSEDKSSVQKALAEFNMKSFDIGVVSKGKEKIRFDN